MKDFLKLKGMKVLVPEKEFNRLVKEGKKREKNHVVTEEKVARVFYKKKLSVRVTFRREYKELLDKFKGAFDGYWLSGDQMPGKPLEVFMDLRRYDEGMRDAIYGKVLSYVRRLEDGI